MQHQPYNWIFFVTLAYGVVLLGLACYIIFLILQESALNTSAEDEQE
ncbi:MAG: hypothetical protein VX112_01225 [Pseudomonadota bacterium]|nr:hypothetical protein [Pseudomonadota bacterium]